MARKGVVKKRRGEKEARSEHGRAVRGGAEKVSAWKGAKVRGRSGVAKCRGWCEKEARSEYGKAVRGGVGR